MFNLCYAGILTNIDDGPSLRGLRRFTLQALRDFGVGKTSIEDKILAEVDEVTQVLLKWNCRPGYLNPELQNLVANITLGIVFGKRYALDVFRFTHLCPFLLDNLNVYFI